MSHSDVILLKLIQECIRNDRYLFTEHALISHPIAEGFTSRQALEAIENGTIIEHRQAESRCLISGTAADLNQSRDFVTTYIHCVCQYDDINKIIIITMYRPKIDQWLNGFTRR